MAATQLEQEVLNVIPTNRRRDNDGVHKRRGVWHYKLKINGRWREFSTKKKKYNEAREVRHEAVKQQKEGRLPSDLAKWRFEKAADRWLAARENRVAPKTYKTEKQLLKALHEAFGGRRLCDITATDIQGYQTSRQTAGLSPKTINLECAVLRMILRSVRLWFPIVDEYKQLPLRKAGPGRALTPEEENELFETASSKARWEVAYYAALLSANTTARSCEIRGLHLADVNLEARTMTVRRVTTKTNAGARLVPLNQTAAWALARLVERANALGSTLPEHYLLPAFNYRKTKEATSSAGKGYDPTIPMCSWRTAWRKLTKAAGLAGFRFHDLRHHYITRLAEAATPDQTLMAIAGHVSREMLEHYSHIRMQAKRQAVEAVEVGSPLQTGSQSAIRPN